MSLQVQQQGQPIAETIQGTALSVIPIWEGEILNHLLEIQSIYICEIFSPIRLDSLFSLLTWL